MTEPGNGTRFQLQDHDRRLAKLESYDLSVLANRLQTLEGRVNGMTKALWATASSLVIAAVTFALAVATGQIG